MNKKTLKFAVALCSVAALASCSDNNMEQSSNNTIPADVFMSFDAAFETSQTRAAIENGAGDGDKTVVWRTGDNISVLPVGTNLDADKVNTKFDLSSGANSDYGVYSGTTLDVSNYVGLYPYQKFAKATSATQMTTVVMPSVQTATEGTFDPKVGLMMGVSTNSPRRFDFKNVCAFIRVTPSVDCSFINIESVESGKYLAGTVDVNYNENAVHGQKTTWTPTTITRSTNSPNYTSMTRTVTLTGSIAGGKTYYIAVLPNTIAAKSLKITFGTCGKVITRTLNEGGDLLRSQYIDLSEACPTTIEDGNWKNTFVDLGLPSGTKWATRNVGAGQPWEIGSFYAWGEIASLGQADDANTNNTGNYKTSTKVLFDWQSYKYGDGTEVIKDIFHMQKYTDKIYYDYDVQTSQYQEKDGDKKHSLDNTDDAAYMLWQCSSYMPTKDQFEELLANCYWQPVNAYQGKSVKGFVVYKRKDGDSTDKTAANYMTTNASYTTSDVHIFLPFTGFYNDTFTYDTTQDVGYYWSRTLYLQRGVGTICTFDEAYDLIIKNAVDNNNVVTSSAVVYHDYRRGGQCIRPVDKIWNKTN